MMTIGVLAVQGAFAEHLAMLGRLGADGFEIRQKSDLLRPMDGLILPGGESTAMEKILTDLDMMDTLRGYIQGGLPVFGTCAGMILLAKTVVGGTPALATMDVTVVRNAYGRQLGSFNMVAAFASHLVPMPFIRAPYIQAAGEGVEILSVVDGHIVAARQGNQLAIAFHPELTEDTTVHRNFLEMVRERQCRG